MPPQAPTGGAIVSFVLSPPSVIVQFTGSAGVDHYDMYRSPTATDIGTKINVAPIPEPATPFNFQFTDDGISSTSAPPVGIKQYYRAVAMDISGNISLPSSALPVNIQAATQVMDSTQKTIYAALVADPTLQGLMSQNAASRIRFHHMIPEEGNDIPFVVFWKQPQKEDKKMRPLRRVIMTYEFEVFDQTQGSILSRQIKERLIRVIETVYQGGALTDCSVHVFSALFLDGGTDLYDERVNLWSYSTRLEIVAELHEV